MKMNHELTDVERIELVKQVEQKWISLSQDLGFEKKGSFFIKQVDVGIQFIRLKRYQVNVWCPFYKLQIGMNYQIPEVLSKGLGKFSDPAKPWALVSGRDVANQMEAQILKKYNLSYQNYRSRYGAANPGEWNFRRVSEVETKFSKISLFLEEVAFPYFKFLEDDNFNNQAWLAALRLHKPMYRVYQLFLAWKLGDKNRYAEIVEYYDGKIPQVSSANEILKSL